MADNVDDIAAAAAAEDAVSVAETGTFAPSTKDFDDGEFVDEDFPPSSLAVFGPDGPQPPADGSIELPSPHSWRRFSDLWPLELLPPSEASLPPQVVQQGPFLGDCWLLSPLAALAARQPKTLRAIFAACTADEFASGRVRIRLCPHGCWWQEVVVDTLLPCDERGRPIFCGTAGAGWAAMVEKAYAKLLGSYAALEGGRCIESLVDLTGGVCHQLKLPKRASDDEPTKEESEALLALGATLRKMHDQRQLICCTRRAREVGEEDSAPHVPSNHAYAVVDVRKTEAVLLRDPAAVRDEDEDAEADDRFSEPTFSADVWVDIAMFAKLFDKLVVCKALPGTQPKLGLKPSGKDAAANPDGPPAVADVAEGGCWLQHRFNVPVVSGGLPSSPMWCDNPQFVLSCSKRCAIVVAFGQRKRQQRVLGLSVLRPDHSAAAPPAAAAQGVGAGGAVDEVPTASTGAQRVWSLDETRLEAQAGPQLSREVVTRFTAEAGNLVLVPWQYAERAKPDSNNGSGHGSGNGADGGGGGEGFTIRVWSDATCSLCKLPSLRRVSAHGSWDAPSEDGSEDCSELGAEEEQELPRTAGGRWPMVTWPTNPQYALCTASAGQAMVILERLSDRPHTDGGRGEGGGEEATGEAAAPAERGGESIPGNAPASADEEGLAKAAADSPFDGANAIGVRVVRAAAASAAVGPPSSVRVSSGMSGNVRSSFGELLETRRHHALDLTEEELNAYGIRGKLKPGAAKPVKSKPAAPTGAASGMPEAEALAAAAAAADGVVHAVASTQEQMEAEFGFESELAASGILSLAPGAPLLVVPSLANSGLSGRYRLRVLSDVPLALKQVVGGGVHSESIAGAWKASGSGPGVGPSGGAAPASQRGGNAGGCHLEDSWGANPQYLLRVGVGGGGDGVGRGGREASLKIVLRRPAEPWATAMQKNSVESMTGFYLLRAPAALAAAGGAGGRPLRKLPLRSRAGLDMIHESCFSPTLEVGCTVQLTPGAEPTALVLVPTTYGPGQLGPFSVELACDAPLHWEALR